MYVYCEYICMYMCVDMDIVTDIPIKYRYWKNKNGSIDLFHRRYNVYRYLTCLLGLDVCRHHQHTHWTKCCLGREPTCSSPSLTQTSLSIAVAQLYMFKLPEDGMRRTYDTSISKNKKTKVLFWKLFGFEWDEQGKPKDSSKPMCKRCNRASPEKVVNMTNLSKYHQDRHPNLYKQSQRAW